MDLGLNLELDRFSKAGSGGGVIPAPVIPSVPSMYMAYEADYAGNTLDNTNQNFNPAAVNIGTSQIDLGFSKFGAFTTGASCNGTLVYFDNTGGALPACIIKGVATVLPANTPFYISFESGTSYSIYPLATDADWPLIAGAIPDENQLIGQHYAQRINKVIFTSQGTGVHRIYSKPLIKRYQSLVDSTFYIEPVTQDSQAYMETDIDADGDRYIRSGRIMREVYGDGVYDMYGKTQYLKPAANVTAAQALKNTIWQTHVFNLDPHVSKGNPKACIQPAGVNTATDVFTYTAHRFVNGDPVKVLAWPTGVLPSPLVANTVYFARKTAANTFTLHTTSAGAIAGTGLIDITTTGTVGLTVYAHMFASDANRQSFYSEVVQPGVGGGNVLTPQDQFSWPSLAGVLNMNTFTITGTSNGNCPNLKTGTDYSTNGVVKVDVFFPSESTPPTIVSTGLPMPSGEYWVTRDGGSSTNGRFHRTYQDALDCVGLTTASLAGGEKVIKFNSQGVGKMLINFAASEGTPINCGWESGQLNFWFPRVPFNQKLVFTIMIVYNPAVGTNSMAYLYLNDVLIQTIDTGIAKALTDAQAGNWGGTYLNSAASHVTGLGKFYAAYFGSSVNELTIADLSPLHTYCKSKYHIA